MFVVIKEGGKQYLLKPKDIVAFEKIEGAAGSNLVLDDVLLLQKDDGSVLVRKEEKLGVKVVCTILEQRKADKVIIFKKKRRKVYQRKRGYRKEVTIARVDEIV